MNTLEDKGYCSCCVCDMMNISFSFAFFSLKYKYNLAVSELGEWVVLRLILQLSRLIGLTTRAQFVNGQGVIFCMVMLFVFSLALL